jgi:hypothetical protein
MGRPLAVVTAGLALFAGVNLVMSAGRALEGSEPDPAPIGSVVAAPVPAPPPATVPLAPSPTTTAGSPTGPTVAAAAPEPVTNAAPPPVPTTVAPVPAPVTTVAPSTGPPAFLAAAVPTLGIGCAGEPFASAFALSGFTPTEVDVASCEIVLDIPGRVPSERVCAQVSGPPVARSIHVATRTVDGDCSRDTLGVVIHEVGHAWHLADPARFYRVLATFGLDPRADASLEVVAECFVEAVGYLDTACGPQGVGYVRAEMDASRIP